MPGWALGPALLPEVPSQPKMPLFTAQRFILLPYVKSGWAAEGLGGWKLREQSNSRYQSRQVSETINLGVPDYAPEFWGAVWPSAGGEGVIEEEVPTPCPDFNQINPTVPGISFRGIF